MKTDIGFLPTLATRDDYIDFLEGYAFPTVEELEQQRATRKLVKTYMLETVGHGAVMPELSEIFRGRVRLDRLDDTMFRVHDAVHQQHVVGLLEAIDNRHPVFYTTMAVQESDRWVRQVVDPNPWLDRLWLSSPILYELWQYVQRSVSPHRYVRLGFDHEAWYESPFEPAGSKGLDRLDAEEANPGLEEGTNEFEDDSDVDADIGSEEDRAGLGLVERRRSKVQLTERLGVLKVRLPQLTELYDPLHSLVQLQIPSGGRGGHLLHFDGKATNRSDSFVEHRATVGLVIRLYRTLTERAEDQLWVETTDAGDDGFRVTGAPVLIRFSNPLSSLTFERFVKLGLQRKTSRFRIGGYLQRRGPTKAHLTAIDRHLWQPFLLEATSRQILAVLPQGTCGNTIHRMVTNVQRFLDPSVQVWLGSEPYEDAVAASFSTAA